MTSVVAERSDTYFLIYSLIVIPSVVDDKAVSAESDEMLFFVNRVVLGHFVLDIYLFVFYLGRRK